MCPLEDVTGNKLTHVDSCHVAVAEYMYAGHSTLYSVVSRIPRLYVTEPLGGACKVEISASQFTELTGPVLCVLVIMALPLIYEYQLHLHVSCYSFSCWRA